MILIIGCNNKNNNYKIINKSKIIKTDDCPVSISYPKIIGLGQKIKMKNLNEVLEKYPEHESYSFLCNSNHSVKGEYEVLLKSDSILSIEFRTVIKDKKQKKSDTIYQTVVLNPNKKNDDEIRALELKDIFPNFKREIIYPFIEDYEKRNKVGINLLAYKTDSNYYITWSISDKYLIIYAGDEGEGDGKYKIKIPMSRIKKYNK